MKSNSKSLLWLVVALSVVVALAARTYVAQKDNLAKAEVACKNGQAILLNGETTVDAFASLLLNRGYVADSEEAHFTARHIIGAIRKNGGRLNGVGDLALRKYGLVLDPDGFARIEPYPGLVLRAEEMMSSIRDVAPIEPTADASLSKRYTVRIKNDRHLSDSVNDSIYICIREHWNETVCNDEGKTIDCVSRDSVYALISICEKGHIWLPVRSAEGSPRFFSLLPVAKGSYFGSAKGTYGNHSRTFKFVRKPAVLQLIGDSVLKRAREDGSILVRSATEYRDKYLSTFAIFIAVWLLAFLFLEAIDKNRGGQSELRILAIVALLCGLGLVTMFNVQDPLWGKFYAWAQLVKGLLPGLVLMIAFAFVDWTDLYRYTHRNYLARRLGGLHGYLLALAAVTLLVVLLLFGQGPGGTRINLPFIHLQGAPLIKLLVLGYFGVFFAGSKDLLQAYNSTGQFWKQMLVVSAMLVLLFVLAVGQLAISDLGPYLVLVLTGVFLFSITTKETVFMITGTGIFAVLLFVVSRLFHGSNWLPYTVYLLWATAWCLYGYKKHGRIHGTTLVLSLVLLLSFHGGVILEKIGIDRLTGREEMAANTFNNEVVGGSQIAEGIWALTRGGLFGSPGTGLAATMPAGFTDLAGLALVENIGLVGFILVLLLLCLLIILELRTGIRSGHPFSFALCSVLALSLGIQSCLIIYGSLGLVPLTGISLPFISYGGTALSCELCAIGIILSLSRKCNYELEIMHTRQFAQIGRAQIWTFLALASIAIIVVSKYTVFMRDKYMVEPGFFINKDGERLPTMYNPLIARTQRQLAIGDILDCKGKVIATTDEYGIRYYPYGSKLFFMVGDLNTKTLWGSAGRRPAGLLAEERYYSLIRGYDTKPITKTKTTHKHYSRFLPVVPLEKEEVVMVEDYSGLLPLMKSKKEIRKWNERKDELNIQLTIDAEFQSALEDRIADFVRRMQREGRLTERSRVVVVAEDAFDGSLLTSAVYPLPDQNLLRERARANATVYRDWAPGFHAFSDMDLALVPHEPGSSSKTISAGAGLMRLSTHIMDPGYYQTVYPEEVVDITLGEPTGNVSLRLAIVKSSNVYFIKLINKYGDKGLYPELSELFYSVGAGFGGLTPYTLYPDQVITSEESFKKQMLDFGELAARKYTAYEESGRRHRLIDGEYQPAWGEGQVSMTPLALCRYIAAIANDGKMMYPRYKTSDSVFVYKQLLSEENAKVLQDCMKGQAEGRFGEISNQIYGKTGTPTRTDRAKGRDGRSNDAIYCLFADAAATTGGHPLAIVIRLERTNDYSRIAMQMTREVVLPVLREKGYLL